MPIGTSLHNARRPALDGPSLRKANDSSVAEDEG
mgnify:CR=1 FL=1|jgi:hypothetical protein